MEKIDSKIDGKLIEWNSIKEPYQWSGILIGNGASINVWNHFNYSSVFSKATTGDVLHPLTDEDQRLFDALGKVTNFEHVLSSLGTAKTINSALGLSTDEIDVRYNSIQRTLIETIHTLHIPWIQTPNNVLQAVRDELLNYSYVYSTNYDLLIYWSIMHHNGGGFLDYFFTEQFDLGNTEVWSKVTAVLYLHGGLHLYRLPTGQTLKRRAMDNANLLELFGKPYYADAVPMIVTEGSPDGKLSSIFRSDYLSFAYNKFSQHQGGLVIFGHSLSANDKHISDAMNKWGKRTLAISMLPDDENSIKREKARIFEKLPEAEIYFFDATTHPLGASDLRVE